MFSNSCLTQGYNLADTCSYFLLKCSHCSVLFAVCSWTDSIPPLSLLLLLSPSQVCSSISIRWVVSLCLSCLGFVPPPNRMHIMLKANALTSSKYNQCHNKEGKEPRASEELLQDLRNQVDFLFSLYFLHSTQNSEIYFYLLLYDSWQHWSQNGMPWNRGARLELNHWPCI